MLLFIIKLKIQNFYLQEEENISDSIHSVKAQINFLHTEHKLIPEPFVVINGPTLNKITSAYVVLGDYTYQVASALKAVDLCFQCVKVFRRKFSHICSHVWEYLESKVYKFEVPNLSGAVTNVIDKLNQI